MTQQASSATVKVLLPAQKNSVPRARKLLALQPRKVILMVAPSMSMSFSATIGMLYEMQIDLRKKEWILGILDGLEVVNECYMSGDELTEQMPKQLIDFTEWLDENFFPKGGVINSDYARLFGNLAMGLYSSQNRISFWTAVTDAFIRARRSGIRGHVVPMKKRSEPGRPGEIARYSEAICKMASGEELAPGLITQLMRIVATYRGATPDVTNSIDRYAEQFSLQDFYRAAKLTALLEPSVEFPYFDQGKERAGKLLLHWIVKMRTRIEDPFSLIKILEQTALKPKP